MAFSALHCLPSASICRSLYVTSQPFRGLPLYRPGIPNCQLKMVYFFVLPLQLFTEVFLGIKLRFCWLYELPSTVSAPPFPLFPSSITRVLFLSLEGILMFLRLRKSNRKNKNGYFIFEDVCFQMRRAGFVNEMLCFSLGDKHPRLLL